MNHSLPKTRKGRERYEQILDAAMQAFAIQGSRHVSLASLAPGVGISEQGLMHYFPTKVHLVIGVLERREEQDRQRFTALAEQGMPLLDLLVEVIRARAAEPQLATLYGVLMAESVDPDHPAHEWFAARNERVRLEMGAAFAMAQQNGEMRQDLDPEAVAAHLIAIVGGLMTQRALASEALDVVSIFEQYIQSLTPDPTPPALHEVSPARTARGSA